MNKFSYIFPSLLLFVAACSSKSDGWTLNGELPADVQTVTLEMPSPAGGWYTSDSVNVDSSGRFTLTLAPAHSDIYRLNVDGKYIYLPADSTETISVVLDPEGGYVIEGSHEAILFSEVNEILDAPADSTTRRRLLIALQNDFSSTAAYYANLRTAWKDMTLLRAVANAYANQRPDDPRTSVLLSQLKSSLKSSAEGETIVIEAPELGYFDIELLNRKGEKTLLSTTVDSHPVTLLAFVNLAEESAPAVNLSIGETFTAYPEIGVYEVGFGENQHQWAGATAELPWVNVFQSESASRTHLGQYAIGSLPVFFIIKNGEIVERIEEPQAIKESMKKYI